MKKLCILLSVVLVFSLACPAAAQTEEPSLLTYEELIELSCAAFPEYADNIRNPEINGATMYSLDDPVVVNEVRAISDNETATYQELASGLAFLSFSHSWDETSSSTSGSVKTVEGVLFVYCTLSQQVFHLYDFKYKINSNGYDAIVSDGETKRSTCNVAHGTNSAYYKQNENADGDAYSRYDLLFYPPDYSAIVPSACGVTLSVGGDNFELTVNGQTYVNP